MRYEDFSGSPSGRLKKTPNGYWAFLPNPLPPKIEYDERLANILAQAASKLSNLAGLGERLPNPHLLVSPCIRREAVLSSRIEGTQASLSDLFFFEAGETKEPVGPRDVLEVSNYVQAMEYGLNRLKELPLSLRLVKELHGILMTGVRGERKTPGEFRTTQNWIGAPGCNLKEATFVPPSPEVLLEILGEWEKFLHYPGEIHPLIQCALVHYQFETIHPFLDGNGRMGRLLITLFLCEKGFLDQPLLYLSAFFNRYRNEYYDSLLAVSREGNWRGWLEFFLRGVAVQSAEAILGAKKVLDLQQEYRLRLGGRRLPAGTLKLLDRLFENPYIGISRAAKLLNVSYHTADRVISRLEKEGILTEITGQTRDRIFAAQELMNALAELD